MDGAHGAESVNRGVEVASDATRPEVGLFLRATRSFKAGELALREAPLLRVKGGVRRLADLDVAAVAASLRGAGLFVPDWAGGEGPPPGGRRAAALLQRGAPHHEGAESRYVRAVLFFNSFAAGPMGTDQVVFPTLARANHSCLPTCIVDGDEGTLRAVRDVGAGEELTLSYLDDATLLWPRERRREELVARYDFTCRCGRCDAAADDVRRFRGCGSAGCGGDLVVVHSESRGAPTMRCVRCAAQPNAEDVLALLASERAASACLEKAKRGDLEEEEEGQELIKCLRFTAKHPTHALAVEMGHDFGFPDPVPAKRAVLECLRVVFGDAPCQLAVEANRELAQHLEMRSETSAAQECSRRMAEVAALLDGTEAPARAAEPEPPAPAPAQHKPARGAARQAAAKNSAPDLELDEGLAFGTDVAPGRPKAAARNVAPDLGLDEGLAFGADVAPARPTEAGEGGPRGGGSARPDAAALARDAPMQVVAGGAEPPSSAAPAGLHPPAGRAAEGEEAAASRAVAQVERSFALGALLASAGLVVSLALGALWRRWASR